MSVIRSMVDSLHRARCFLRPVREGSHTDAADAVDRGLAEGWSAEDIVEASLDDATTAAAVGSGAARTLGTRGRRFRDGADDQDDVVERRFVEWAARTGSWDPGAFMDAYAPGASAATRQRWRAQLRELTP